MAPRADCPQVVRRVTLDGFDALIPVRAEEHFEQLKQFVSSHQAELREIEELFDESRGEVYQLYR